MDERRGRVRQFVIVPRADRAWAIPHVLPFAFCFIPCSTSNLLVEPIEFKITRQNIKHMKTKVEHRNTIDTFLSLLISGTNRVHDIQQRQPKFVVFPIPKTLVVVARAGSKSLSLTQPALSTLATVARGT